MASPKLNLIIVLIVTALNGQWKITILPDLNLSTCQTNQRCVNFVPRTNKNFTILLEIDTNSLSVVPVAVSLKRLKLSYVNFPLSL